MSDAPCSTVPRIPARNARTFHAYQGVTHDLIGLTTRRLRMRSRVPVCVAVATVAVCLIGSTAFAADAVIVQDGQSRAAIYAAPEVMAPEDKPPVQGNN